MTEEEARDIAENITINNAYPFVVETTYDRGTLRSWRSGLSKRELFAAMILQGIINSGSNVHAIESNCKLSVKYADALLKELNDGEKD